jgi:hypothetical protein
VHVSEEVIVESDPKASAALEEIETETWEVLEELTYPDNQGKPQMH